jgi:SAM-dependent methyltransferase
VHDAGATPFLPIAAYLVTGQGAALTLGHEQLLARYVDRARRERATSGWPAGSVRAERRLAVEGLRWLTSVDDVLAAVGAHVYAGPAAISDASIDLCHSGGALEHEPLDALDAFLTEQVRVLRPGGVASHVFDHRDHLHHADRTLPFLFHLAWPEPVYRALFGHSLGYHSRLSPAQVTARFAAAGLQRLAVRRLIYDAHTGERRWVESEEQALAGAPGIPRARLAARFRGWSDADLRTAAVHYVYARQ